MINLEKFRATDKYVTRILKCDWCGKRAKEIDSSWPTRSHKNRFTAPNLILFFDFCSDPCAEAWDGRVVEI